MQKVFIYTLSDPNTKKIRYVGKSINPKRRLKDHYYNKRRTYCSNWIWSLKDSNQKPILNIIEECNEDNWEEAEQYWICQFKAWGFKLTNHTDGGEGMHGFTVSEETRQKMSKAHKGSSYALGCNRDDEFKRNLSNKLQGNDRAKGSIRNERFRQRVSELKKGENNSNASLTKEEVIEICKLLSKGVKGSVICNKFNKLTIAMLSFIKTGVRWTHISKDYLTEPESFSDVPLPEKEEKVKELIELGVSEKNLSKRSGLTRYKIKQIKNGKSIS